MDQATHLFRYALVGVRHGARDGVYQFRNPNFFL